MAVKAEMALRLAEMSMIRWMRCVVLKVMERFTCMSW